MEHNTTAGTESRRPRRRPDNWALQALSPAISPHETALSDAIARQSSTQPNRSTSMSNRFRRVLRRLDDWTLTVFNPYFASDHR